MNYGKKDEDADSGLVKVDRTQVFQEGECSHRNLAELSVWELKNGQRDCSTARRSSPEDAASS
jgi:hypothetical protein